MFVVLTFLKTNSMDLNMLFSEQIRLFELYNFAEHLIHIIWWHQIEKFNLKIFSIHFPYISIHFNNERF